MARAGKYKSLELHSGCGYGQSKSIKVYDLDERMLACLAKAGIVRQPRPDGIFTLIDTNPQKPPAPGWANSDYWNFPVDEKTGKYDLSVGIYVLLSIIKELGVALIPRAFGRISADDALPNYRMFKALVDADDDAPAFAKEMADSDGRLIVTWEELGLVGMLTVDELFSIFTHGNRQVRSLANYNVFDPSPDTLRDSFVVRDAQAVVLTTWREQLEAFRDSLVL